EWHTGRDAFSHANNVWLHSGVLDCPPFSGASDAALNFVRNQQNAVAITNPPQFFHEDLGCWDISAFALHRLDEDGCDLLGRKSGLEQFLLDEARTGQRVVLAFAVDVWIRNVRHSG